jgi:hypothetical protein
VGIVAIFANIYLSLRTTRLPGDFSSLSENAARPEKISQQTAGERQD